MKKLGFTLAEVLITLGIVGIIAAVTLPTLMNNTTNAQIGPKLAKAVSAFEQANQALLTDRMVDSLTDLNFASADAYGNALSLFMKIVSTDTLPEAVSHGNTCIADSSDGSAYMSKDGVVYVLNAIGAVAGNGGASPHMQRVTGTVYIDINGANDPNAMGTDRFAFALYNDGSLRPVGGASWGVGIDDACTWQVSCPVAAIATDYVACAGHIFENNLKVLYK